MESREIPIDGSGNKSWEYLRAVAKEDLEEIGKTYGVDKDSYAKLIPELKDWHEILMQGYLHNKHF